MAADLEKTRGVFLAKIKTLTEWKQLHVKGFSFFVRIKLFFTFSKTGHTNELTL